MTRDTNAVASYELPRVFVDVIRKHLKAPAAACSPIERLMGICIVPCDAPWMKDRWVARDRHGKIIGAGRLDGETHDAAKESA